MQREKPSFGDRLFKLRFRRLNLSQEAFAKRYGLTHGMVKDAEQGRHNPSRAFVSLVAVIERDPDLAADAVRDAAPAK